eukprot:1781-Rhodomonas_salina.2
MAAEFAKKLFEGGPAPPEGGKTIAYGTAGFRTKPCVIVGILNLPVVLTPSALALSVHARGRHGVSENDTVNHSTVI